MGTYSVLLEYGDAQAGGQLGLDDARTDGLLDALGELGPSVAAGTDRYSVRVCVTADDADAALAAARRAVDAARRQVGAPMWPLAGLAVERWDD